MKERDQIEAAIDELVKTLPPDWKVREVQLEPTLTIDGALRRPDAIVELAAPDGTSSRILLEAKSKSIEPRDVERFAGMLATYGGAGIPALTGVALPPTPLGFLAGALVTAAFVSPRARELLKKLGIGYADRTGNLRLQLERPPLFVERQGEEKNPDPEPRSLQSLKGPAAGRVARALCDFLPPYGIRELAERANAGLGSVARVVELLDREAIVTRNETRGIASVDWVALVKRWSDDRNDSPEGRTFRDPRGLDSLLEKLRVSEFRYAVTGSFAAAQVAPFAPPRLLTMYVESTKTAAKELDIKEVETGANVMLIEPFDPVVFERSWEGSGITNTALSQVLSDLSRAAGRGPEIAAELIPWMRANEGRWRAPL